MCVLSCFTHVRFFAIPWTVDCQDPLFMAFSKQEYQSGLPCLPSGDLPNTGMEPTSFMSPASAGRFFTTSTIGEDSLFVSSNFWCLLAFLGSCCLSQLSVSLFTQPSLLCICLIFPCLSLIRMLVIAFRVHPDYPVYSLHTLPHIIAFESSCIRILYLWWREGYFSTYTSTYSQFSYLGIQC